MPKLGTKRLQLAALVVVGALTVLSCGGDSEEAVEAETAEAEANPEPVAGEAEAEADAGAEAGVILALKEEMGDARYDEFATAVCQLSEGSMDAPDFARNLSSLVSELETDQAVFTVATIMTDQCPDEAVRHGLFVE